jgi:exopolyphosphatase/pppGpp-phosphohydrolase
MPNFLVLELGSKSLKIHRKTQSGRFEKVSVAWTLGHEVYRDGKISAATLKQVGEVIRKLESRGFRREAKLAIGTGAVRDTQEGEAFVEYFKARLKIKVRILTGREEASLLAQGFLSGANQPPALVLDIGGGSLETVYLEPNRTLLRDSLPLGAIRLHYMGLETGGGFDFRMVEDHIESVLREASVIQIPVVSGTGGPVKAISKVIGSPEISLGALAALEERVRRDGPPDTLSEERRTIFLPGVMVMRRLLIHCRAECLRYLSIPIGRIFLERFIGRTQPQLGDSTNVRMLSNLRITQIFNRNEFTGRAPPAP